MSKHLAVIFSDLHIHDYKQFNKNGKRLDDCLKVLYDLGEFCERNSIDTVLFSGDLYDSQKNLPTIVVNRTVDTFLELFTKYPNLKFYAITGNHDQSTKNLIGSEAVSALHHINSICPHNFIVVDNDLKLIDDGIIVAGVPYYEYKEHYQQKLQEIAENTACAKAGLEEDGVLTKAFLMIHQTPRSISNAMIPFEAEPKDPLLDIFDYTFCGHIHARQDLAEKFTVVGNPIHRDLADAGKDKGFLVMNLCKPENGYKFIKLKGYPEFVQKYEDEITDEDTADNYVVPKIRVEDIKLNSKANVDDFNTGLEAQELVQNYWKEADGKDEELLQIGLSFLK